MIAPSYESPQDKAVDVLIAQAEENYEKNKAKFEEAIKEAGIIAHGIEGKHFLRLLRKNSHTEFYNLMASLKRVLATMEGVSEEFTESPQAVEGDQK